MSNIKELKSGLKKEGINTKIRFDLIPLELLEAISKQFMYGANKYGERNWQKSTKEESKIFKEAALRHCLKWIHNIKDGEEHGIACITNIIMFEYINKND